MREASRLFEPLDFFMMRAPLLSLDEYTELNRQENLLTALIAFADRNDVKETLLLSSHSLYQVLDRLHDLSSSRKSKQVFSGVLRYLLRMMSRPTPYGMFAGVALGSFDDKTDIKLLDRSQYRKHSRPDMGWLLGLINDLEQRVVVARQLTVQWNHSVQRVGKRLQHSYCSY